MVLRGSRPEQMSCGRHLLADRDGKKHAIDKVLRVITVENPIPFQTVLSALQRVPVITVIIAMFLFIPL